MKTHALPKPIKSKNPIVILRHVIKAIKEEPKRYDQSTYITTQADSGGVLPVEYFPTCGTVCCVAGWVNRITGASNVDYGAQKPLAQITLGLTESEADSFFGGGAVTPRDKKGMTPRRHAALGIKHIKRFVLKKWGKKI